MCNSTRLCDDNHIMCVVGVPVSPKVYDTRPARKSMPLPVDTLGVMGTPRPATPHPSQGILNPMSFYIARCDKQSKSCSAGARL